MGIVTKAQRQEMSNYVANLLENSEKVKILYKFTDDIIVQSNETGKQCQIILHGKKRKTEELTSIINRNIEYGKYTGNIFYKDNENFHVRLGFQAKKRKSLKKYQDENKTPFKILHLRALEKLILEKQSRIKDMGNVLTYVLTYFQPETDRLKQSLRLYEMQPVELDYNHIPETDQKFDYVENKESTDYKIAEHLTDITDGNEIELVDFEKSPFMILTTKDVLDLNKLKNIS